jgi:CDP-diacylglycerol--glycerol-3-phosphate 3-phosphatidyltransferase
MTITLANRITLVRVFNVPLFVALVVYYKQGLAHGTATEPYRYLALAVFVISIVLDVIDGWLARKRKEETQLGAILDPVADKALLVSAYVLLSGNASLAPVTPVPTWMAVLVISRDVVLVAGALVINLLSGRMRIVPRFLGKLTTFLQTAVVILALSSCPHRVLIVLVISAAVATLASGVQYTIDGYRQLERI